ncbi:MAG: DUF6722 family protein [Bacteroidota bacterium]|nr:DUF6722 family protein [Bacteroidota bacterium]
MLIKEVAKEFSKLLIDISKLLIGGGIIASILKFEEINRIALISILSVSVLLLLSLAFYIIKKTNKD